MKIFYLQLFSHADMTIALHGWRMHAAPKAVLHVYIAHLECFLDYCLYNYTYGKYMCFWWF